MSNRHPPMQDLQTTPLQTSKNMTDNVYCEIKAKSPAAEPIQKFFDSIKDQRKWAIKFAKENGLPKHEFIQCNSSIVGISPGDKVTWYDFRTALPLWRLIKSRGCDYAIPRRVGPDAKALAKAWDYMPKIISRDWVKESVTGVIGWNEWMRGLTLHGMGYRKRKDGSFLVIMPYFIPKSKAWKPMDGLTIGADQDALRDEWNKE